MKCKISKFSLRHNFLENYYLQRIELHVLEFFLINIFLCDILTKKFVLKNNGLIFYPFFVFSRGVEFPMAVLLIEINAYNLT